jgi:hypothetical protein
MDQQTTILGESLKEVKSRELYNNDFDLGIQGIYGLPGKLYPFSYPFGVEIENDRGYQIDGSTVKGKGLCLLKKEDVSINGMEYVTGILAGDEGMIELQRITELMDSHSFGAWDIGVHVHLSGICMNPSLDMRYWIALNRMMSIHVMAAMKRPRKYTNALCIEDLRDNCRQWLAGIEDNVDTGRYAWRMNHYIGPLNEESLQPWTMEWRTLEGTNDYNLIRTYILLISSITDYFEETHLDWRDFNNEKDRTWNNADWDQLESCMPNITDVIMTRKKLSDKDKQDVMNFLTR